MTHRPTLDPNLFHYPKKYVNTHPLFRCFSLFLMLFLLNNFLIFSQDDTEIDKWMNLNLEDLGKVKLVSVSIGKKDVSIREAPGILSMITSEEIENSGARDLIDVLRMVPGFDFGVDVEGAIGIGVRGNWAHEGKAMLLIDGQEMNELVYATLQFGAHFPVRQIDRIEIIRGPGSSLYGEFAELAVINIITRSNPGENGTTITADYGQMSRTFARRNLSLQTNHQWGDFNLDLGAHLGDANQSQLTYTDVYGDSYEMKDDSRIHSAGVNLNVKYKDLSARFLMDLYNYTMRDVFDAIYPLPTKVEFNSYFFETKYECRLWNHFKLVPKINYSSQLPWAFRDPNSIAQDLYFNVRADRLKFSLNFSGDVSDKIFINTGLIQNFDHAAILGNTPEEYYFNGQRKKNLSNSAGFVQTFIKTPIVILTAGFRYDHNSQYGNSIVPWVGINKVYNKFYFKFLFGQTFRVPTFLNISLNPEIKPEKSNEFDMEIGYQLTKAMMLSMNFFSTGIKDPIVYSTVPGTDEEYYANFGKTGTYGFELEYLIKSEWGYVNANYSYYHAKKDKLDLYSVDVDHAYMLGFPVHKITVNSNFEITDKFSINPSLVYYSKRYGYDSTDSEGNYVLNTFDPVLLGNVYVLAKKIIGNLDIGLGVYDIFGKNYRFIQPYKGGHAPYPGPGREVMLRVNFGI
ncbi:MAG: TonB-dependent receptor plug domain-containing protein [Candidatus Omnitrophota bacterium]